MRLAVMRGAAAQRGDVLVTPLLLVGTSERVGSNWLSDTLAAWWGQYNEPLRQQLDATHPLSACNPAPVCLDELVDADLGPFGRHWLVTFAAGKYGPVRQVVKETNLFFAVEVLLRLLPDAPLVVASRSPLGVVSSFVRGDLYTRWDYPARYRQLHAMTAAPARRRPGHRDRAGAAGRAQHAVAGRRARPA
ncbi:hypothetical protein HC028_26250 [Planosporangium flavigriseum]|uniref:Sulfotransferase family protein n=1 Tax=Planosporangium flavigriseum TaxID=373681 RepID=A0A8J3LS51_9ACTN|nr:hypothetical protein [Planosporangium flavigriseum]NJC67981.1 hypothetical protein [Planosporangium flavigriseum]GIG76619.1 hypothetical protein Pfl04_50230 [Planosporangium flavigriseum]